MRKAKVEKVKATVAFEDRPPSANTDEHSIVLYGEYGRNSPKDREYFCSPLEFHDFIPWVCKEFCVPAEVIVIRKAQDNFVKSRKTTKYVRSLPNLTLFDDSGIAGLNSFSDILETEESVVVVVTAYYDAKLQLTEISLAGNTVVPRKIINAFSLSIPYHTMLTRFTFRRSGLTAELVYEINKLMPISNICEIVLDDSYVREGNYYILLEQNLQLKYLSLNRCKINDEVCEKIFEKIVFDGPAGNTLQILELGSNEISDEGAIFIGSVLRSNRCLLHLNLSGNRITDSGFIPILNSLMEFPINSEEENTMRRKKIRYLQSKEAVYARCISDLKSRYCDDLDIGGMSLKKTHSKRFRTKQKKMEHRNLEADAEMMARGILGEFIDPFSNVDLKNGSFYSKGNFILCSINIAYNNLEYSSIRRLWEVLRYQDGMRISKSGKDTGLIRITLDGNKTPQICPELDGIEFYLKKVINLKTEVANKKKAKPRSRIFKKSSSSVDD